MVRSMTGFGRGENGDDFRNFTVELKSLNHRYNDIIIKMPKYLNYLEDNIKKTIKSKVSRGRVEVFINTEYIGEGDTEVKVDISLAKSYKEALDTIKSKLELNDEITLELITGFPDILKTEKRNEDEDEIWLCLKSALELALDNMLEMRSQEGKELANDIEDKSMKIIELVNKVKLRSPLIVTEYKEKLWTRIKELLEDKYELDENKLANEVAYFADKYGIDEELVRLESHISQMSKTLKTDNSIGRKLDFIIQEMNREANTIGSKVGDIEITNYVVEIKSELEKIREQVQNIE